MTQRGLLTLLVLASFSTTLLFGCRSAKAPTAAEPTSSDGLPKSAYYVDPSLETWIDPETGYDTTRTWKLEGGEWPVALIMSPSQSPQLLVGDKEGIFDKALEPYGIDPNVEKIELPPRTFHALQRSKWPFVYMPYAVFVDYARTNDNQGGAGGLQYVALAGSTAGGGYTLITKDPNIKSVADLKGKSVAGLENNPARIVLMRAAAEKAGLELGTGPDDISFSAGKSEDDLNDYLAGKYDALVVLNIVRDRFLRTGSRQLTDFTDVGYRPNYTILAVERTVLEEKPEVVYAFLEAHYQSNLRVAQTPPDDLNKLLMESWNGYFRTQDTTVAAQRIAPSEAVFQQLVGNMRPEQRIDPDLLQDCFTYLDRTDGWGWGASVEWKKLLALDRYDKVLQLRGEEPQ